MVSKIDNIYEEEEAYTQLTHELDDIVRVYEKMFAEPMGATLGDVRTAFYSRQSNNIWAPKTERQFTTTYSNRHIFYAVLHEKTWRGTTIHDKISSHAAANAKGDGIPDFDAGLYAWRVEGQRYLVSVGKDYSLDYIHFSLPCVSVERPQLNVPESCEAILTDE